MIYNMSYAKWKGLAAMLTTNEVGESNFQLTISIIIIWNESSLLPTL